MMNNSNPFQFAKSALRKKSLEWPERSEAIKKSKRGFKYECSSCKQLFKRYDVELNHKNPVMPVEEEHITMDQFVLRLFCKAEDFEVLCKSCHRNVTMLQNSMRKFYKKKNK